MKKKQFSLTGNLFFFHSVSLSFSFTSIRIGNHICGKEKKKKKKKLPEGLLLPFLNIVHLLF